VISFFRGIFSCAESPLCGISSARPLRNSCPPSQDGYQSLEGCGFHEPGGVLTHSAHFRLALKRVRRELFSPLLPRQIRTRAPRPRSRRVTLRVKLAPVPLPSEPLSRKNPFFFFFSMYLFVCTRQAKNFLWHPPPFFVLEEEEIPPVIYFFSRT